MMHHFLHLLAEPVVIQAQRPKSINIMAHLLSKSKEQVTEALSKATAAMNIGDQSQQQSEQPKSGPSQGE